MASLCLLRNYTFAQDKTKGQFGKVSAVNFSIPSSSIIDSNTNAVILSDVGSVHFIGNKNNWFSHVFKRQHRIHILNKKAFALATVMIPLRIQADNGEKVDRLTASTYNLENGQVAQTKLDPKEVFEEREDKNYIKKKFTMLAGKDGCII